MRPVVWFDVYQQQRKEQQGKDGRTYRTVVPLDVGRRAKLREDVLREDLAELDTHLVYNLVQTTATRCREDKEHTEGVDAPDDALHKDLVLVQRDQRPFLSTEIHISPPISKIR